eukprot:6464205-Amphidinium_carterae.2
MAPTQEAILEAEPAEHVELFTVYLHTSIGFIKFPSQAASLLAHGRLQSKQFRIPDTDTVLWVGFKRTQGQKARAASLARAVAFADSKGSVASELCRRSSKIWQGEKEVGSLDRFGARFVWNESWFAARSIARLEAEAAIASQNLAGAPTATALLLQELYAQGSLMGFLSLVDQNLVPRAQSTSKLLPPHLLDQFSPAIEYVSAAGNSVYLGGRTLHRRVGILLRQCYVPRVLESFSGEFLVCIVLKFGSRLLFLVSAHLPPSE